MKNKKIFQILDNVYESINSVKDIKLKLVKGEFHDEYHCEGTTYLPPCKVVAYSPTSFDIFRKNDDYLYVHVKGVDTVLSFDTSIKSLEGVKKWIASFDRMYEDALKAGSNKKTGIIDNNELFTSYVPYTPKSNLNKTLKLRIYKKVNCKSLGIAMAGKSMVDKYTVKKVLTVSNRDYDQLITDAHNTRIKFDETIAGFGKSYEVHQVISKNRRELYIHSMASDVPRFYLLPLD